MDRRSFLLSVGAGTLGALTSVTACTGTEVAGTPTPSSAPSIPKTSIPKTAPSTPVIQTGPPTLTKVTPTRTVIASVPDTPRLVALTLDDGISSPVVNAYVELAKATGIRLTFFANGANSSWSDNQKAMQPLIDSGQVQMANHTWDHPDIRKISGSELASQLGRNDKHLKNLCGASTRPYFRPPYMAHNSSTDSICVDEGYSVITWWTGSFGDSTEITAAQVLQNAHDYLKPGNIVIGHANFPAVTTVFDKIIELIQSRHLQTVTLADVFTTPAG